MRISESIMPQNYQAVQILLASSDQILSWSSGEVKTPETINYRTFKPERDGLFCGKIFGPVKDYECICGKYKRMKHRDIRCEKCGVEVIKASVRRERLGHIKLVSPATHLWFLKVIPSKLSGFLDISTKNLERVIYFDAYLVVDPGASGLKVGDVIDENTHQENVDRFSDYNGMMGAEAIKVLIENKGSLEDICKEIRENIIKTNSETKRIKLSKRLKIVEGFLLSKIDPKNMILDVLPVISPELRPLVPLDGGRFATSDLNDLYRRIIHRNNRLKRLIDLNAPEVILKNEKRMLQEAVDALIDNNRRNKPILGKNKRPLKSLSDSLMGKYGRFRHNLLGKRVDYSGRTVIVVGPNLKLNQCGIPKLMALELFKPFIFNHLIKNEKASTIKVAKKMIENNDPEIWAALDDVIYEHPVLLNRAPTLHRLGIQAFEPILIEGKAIQLHPLVCAAFNADFDGDQMAIHIPLSIEAQMEAKVLMMATNNLLSISTGKPIMTPSQDMVLGIYWLGKQFDKRLGEGKIFSNAGDAIRSYEHGLVDLQAKIKVQINDEIHDTSVGRVILYASMPKNFDFKLVNRLFKKKDIEELIAYLYREYGNVETVSVLDQIKNLGFSYATKAGFTISTDDMVIPKEKKSILDKAYKEVNRIHKQHSEGIITTGERYNKVIDIWSHATEDIAKEMVESISNEIVDESNRISLNPIYAMADSGARGSINQSKQLGGMRGLMANSVGHIIETPITANFREGLTVHQNFISTHGARKGLADTALKTGFSGYLTRKLVDVAQDVVITIDDCGTKHFVEFTDLIVEGELIEKLSDRILGRVLASDLKNPKNNRIIYKKGTLLDEKIVIEVSKLGIDSVKIRSVMSCEAEQGLCANCYGRDLARGNLVSIGEAVGVIAGQSIGEPGTQLTMRTFHIGGIASGKAEDSSCSASVNGKISLKRVRIVKNRKGQDIAINQSKVLVLDKKDKVLLSYQIKPGALIFVKDEQEVKRGDLIAEWDPLIIPIISDVNGKVKFTNLTDKEGKPTIITKVDEITGRTRMLVSPSIRIDEAPLLKIYNSKTGRPLNHHGYKISIPAGIYNEVEILVKDGAEIEAGDVLVKLLKIKKHSDITGGLWRVNEFFNLQSKESIKVKIHQSERETYCEISGLSGFVEFGDIKRKKRQVIVKSEDDSKKWICEIPENDIIVMEGDYVEAGDPLTYGRVDPRDLLKVKGVDITVQHLVNEIQKLYRMQGVKIDDKQFEIIIRQMLQKVEIIAPNDSKFLKNEIVSKKIFNKTNKTLVSEGKKAAIAEPILQGITKAALSTGSFLSNASFQETAKLLTESAIEGKVDYLNGLKENVIFGRLIPAGTGFYVDKHVGYDYKDEESAKKVEKEKEEISN